VPPATGADLPPALAAMMERAGFDRVEVHSLAAGAVALHLGYHY